MPDLSDRGVLGCRDVGVNHGYYEWASRSSAYDVVSRRAYCLCERDKMYQKKYRVIEVSGLLTISQELHPGAQSDWLRCWLRECDFQQDLRVEWHIDISGDLIINRRQ